MTYEVLIQQRDNRFSATVLSLPGCTVEAPTRAEAIQRAREAAASLIGNGEIVEIEVGAPGGVVPPRSVAEFAGIWRDDETFAEFVAAIETYRKEVDADAAQP